MTGHYRKDSDVRRVKQKEGIVAAIKIRQRRAMTTKIRKRKRKREKTKLVAI